MNVLVTGGAGFIGSVTVDYLQRSGHTVTVYDSLENGNWGAVPEGTPIMMGDVGSETALKQAFEQAQPEAVIHFAAYIEAGISMKQPAMYFRNNVMNTLNLLEVMKDQGVDKLVFSSTAGIFATQDTALAEDDPRGPANVYAESKLMVERLLHWYHEIFGLNYCVLRYFNAAGAVVAADGTPIRGEAHDPESHLIPLILQVALGQRESISIFGTDYPTPDGTCIRDYIHVEDLARAHVLALQALAETGGTLHYNLGAGEGHSVREVIEMAREVTGHPIPAIETPRRPGDAARLVANSTRASEELGWEPHFSDLRTIVATAWTWHQTHPEGYKKPR